MANKIKVLNKMFRYADIAVVQKTIRLPPIY